MKIPKQVRKVSKMEKRILLARGLKLNEEAGELSADHPAFDATAFDAKEQSVKKHLDRLLKKAHARTISAREEQLLSRLKDEWQRILDKKSAKI